MYVLALPINNSQAQETYFYRNKDGKPQVFTFNTIDAAQKCLQIFQQYAVEENMKVNQNPFAFPEVLSFCSSFKIKELPSGFTCDLVSFEKIMGEKGINI